MAKGKGHAKRSTDIPSSSRSQRHRSGPIIVPAIDFQELPAHYFASIDHKLRFNEQFFNREVNHGKTVDGALLHNVGFWNLDYNVNGIGFMFNLPNEVCELVVKLFFCHLTDSYEDGVYHIGFQYRRPQRRSNVLYSYVFGKHIELPLTRLGEFIQIAPGGLDILQESFYDIREICTHMYGHIKFSGH